MTDKRLIDVCLCCGTSICMQGEFMCGNSANAGSELKPAYSLKDNGEHKSNYSKGKIKECYGESAPFGYEADQDDKGTEAN